MTAKGYTLYDHQRKAFDKAVEHGSYGLFMETGTGKTLVGIELISHWLKLDPNFRTLVVCPLSCIEAVWISEIAKFAPHISTLNLWKHRKTQAEKIPVADVYVVNYESAQLIDPRFLATFDLVILDESTKIKSPTTKVTKFFLEMKRYWKKRLVFSGLPAPNNLMEYWAQMNFVNPKILGDSFWKFRATNFFQIGRISWLWKPTKEFKERLPILLAKQAMVVKKADCLDLPEQIYTVRNCELEPTQRKSYDQMVKANITTLRGRAVLAANELAKLMKLRQMTSGFAVDAMGEAQEFVCDAKLKLLEEVLDSIGDRQVIIWIQFHKEIEKIKGMLADRPKSLDNSCAVLAGTESQGDKDRAIEDFVAGKIKYLIAHPKTAGHGLTFVNCSYAVYYSLSYSLEEYIQSQDRIHRIGQKESVTYIHLIAEKTIDEVIYRALRNKESISEAVLCMVRDLSKEAA